MVRLSSGWCESDWWYECSSTTTSAAANPASRSPYDHSSVASASIGISPGPSPARSASVHLTSASSRPLVVLPSVRAFGPPRRLSSGSRTNGIGSRSMSMSSMALAAVSSSTAATARIGSPS